MALHHSLLPTPQDAGQHLPPARAADLKPLSFPFLIQGFL